MDSTEHYYEQFVIQSNLNLEIVHHIVILDFLPKKNKKQIFQKQLE